MLKTLSRPGLRRGWMMMRTLGLVAGMGLTARAADAPIDAQLAIKQFQVPAGFKIELWAAEPQLMNPVSFGFDEQGRVYVVETFRYQTSTYDIRDHMNMYDDDLASRTVEDRVAMMKKFLGDKIGGLAVESEKVQLLEDRAGKGRADQSTLFADGFNTLADGVAAGVLARQGKVYFANLPNLWLLQDTNHDGKADLRTSLSYGYGVHFNLTGHDLHGLRFGPDGKLYFSMGDRGIHVKTKEGTLIDYPDMGGVLRCNPDGSGLEMFASGLRNPQELAFDDHGNLFTGDNNCDHGDAARFVYVVEGGDSGWRTANQFSETTPAGVWNAEKLWHLQFPGQAAYILPPSGHVANGPSGFTHYPGTGFSPAYRDHFFLCDFRGASGNSGVHSFAAEPNGATFKLIDRKNFFWGILATDADFSPDGQLYVTDWVQGWPQSGLGRIYRCYDAAQVDRPLVKETKQLIGEGMPKRSLAELGKLLGHADQRVRQEAQFELATRGSAGAGMFMAVATGKTSDQLARLHAVWGLGQLAARGEAGALPPVAKLLNDADPEVQAQAAKVVGEGHYSAAARTLIQLLHEGAPRVQFFSALSLGKLGATEAVEPLLALLRDNADRDVYLRHAAVMGLLGTAPQGRLITAARDSSPAVRMGVLLAMRRLAMPEIAGFLHDTNELIVLEAARAINDLPIRAALPELASLTQHPRKNHPLDWRAVNAAYKVGGAPMAQALARVAGDETAGEKVRAEALRDLATWAAPTPRDRLTGLWQPLPQRPGQPAVAALRPVITELLTKSPGPVQLAALDAARKLNLSEAGPAMVVVVANKELAANVRVAALKTLEELGAPGAVEAVKIAVADENQTVRTEGQRVQALLQPNDAVNQIANVLETGSLLEKQGAFANLAKLTDPAAERLLVLWLRKLTAGQVARELQFDVLEAAKGRKADAVKAALKEYQATQPATDAFVGFRETLYGGDADAGRKLFMEKPEAACTRCHKISGAGGEVGPELTGIITRHDREYLLESILYPNKQIAAGFETVLIKLKNGDLVSGIVKGEQNGELTLNVNDDGLFKVMKFKTADIESRQRGQSAMPEGFGQVLSKTEIRNLVEFLANVK